MIHTPINARKMESQSRPQYQRVFRTLHLWRGRAVDLAGHDAIAVYPVGGWWKSYPGQKRVSDKARYALVISISAPGQNVDLYSEIAAIVEVKEIDIPVG